jgi:hypothetical protein
MSVPAETKYQGWRALAILDDNSERLIFVGRSAPHVRAEYGAAFLKLLDEFEQASVQTISLQCWHGAADRGTWQTRSELPPPDRHAIESRRGRSTSRFSTDQCPGKFSLN